MALGIECTAENAQRIWSASIVSEEGTTVNQLSMKRVSAERSVKQIATVTSEMQHGVHDDQYDLYHFSAQSNSHPLQVSLEVEWQIVMMEIDTGTSDSVISMEEHQRQWPGVALPTADIQL